MSKDVIASRIGDFKVLGLFPKLSTYRYQKANRSVLSYLLYILGSVLILIITVIPFILPIVGVFYKAFIFEHSFKKQNPDQKLWCITAKRKGLWGQNKEEVQFTDHFVTIALTEAEAIEKVKWHYTNEFKIEYDAHPWPLNTAIEVDPKMWILSKEERD